MTSSKKRSRARHRVERTMEEAFEAAARGRLHLAERLSARAIDEGFVNPRIWCDRGRIARLCGDDEAAEHAFRHAVAIAPTYGDAFAELGRLQAERGRLAAAERLMRRALELRPGDPTLVAEHARVAAHRIDEPSAAERRDVIDDDEPAPFTARTARYDWDQAAAELLARGLVRLPRFCDVGECRALAGLPADRFESELVRDDVGARARWEFLRLPLPSAVDAMRAELYARLAGVADALYERVGAPERAPRALPTLAARCARAGQVRSGVSLLRLGAAGFVTAAAAAARPDVAFPFRALIFVGPEGRWTHVLRDLRPGRRAHAATTELEPGDALIACDRWRIVAVGGVDGIQAVAHGAGPVDRGERAALCLSFVEE